MTKITIATLFSGGEGVGCGAKAAGLEHLWGIEYDPDIAAVAAANGFKACVLDVAACDPDDFERPDVLHASPPCPNFSAAKMNRAETTADIAMGKAVGRFIKALRPAAFTLENVYGYRKAKSFKKILGVLKEYGYQYDWWHLNFADYGVPQTRKRLVLIASLDFKPKKPQVTHRDPKNIREGQPSLFGENLPPWIGWYEAIEDLIQTLPESQFAPWQLKRLPKELKESLLMWSNGNLESWGRHHVDVDEPALSVTAQTGGRARALILDAKNSRPEREGKVDHTTGRIDNEPIWTIQGETGPGHVRALIVGENPNARGQCREGDEPMKTIAAQPAEGLPRAFIVAPNSNPASCGDNTRDEDDPNFTITPNANERMRAFLVGGQYGQPTGTPNRSAQCTEGPAFTVTAVNKGDWAGTAAGRVVQMTPRALARFQSFPDWYELPEKKILAYRVIGNAVPPLLYQRLIGGVLEQLRQSIDRREDK